MSKRESTGRRTRLWLMATLMAGAIALMPRVASAQTGTVTGRVVDAQSGAPVTSAQVMVTGTTIGSAVDSDGRFRLTNVPVGAKQIRVRGIGYQPNTTALSSRVSATRTKRRACSSIEKSQALCCY